MFYLSPTLTALMLAIVPPISLGAVSVPDNEPLYRLTVLFAGTLRPLSQETLAEDTGNPWENV
jgi:hypothetical protein